MNFIKIVFLGVEGVAEDAVQDVISWKKIIGASTTSSPGNVEINHLVLGHRLVAKVNTEDIGGVGWRSGVSKSIGKLLPSGTHEKFLGHPSEGANFILILLKVDGGIELANDLVVERMVEVHQGHDPKLFTNGFGFSKILEVGIHLLHVGGPLGATSKVLDFIDLIEYLLLILGVEVRIGA